MLNFKNSYICNGVNHRWIVAIAIHSVLLKPSVIHSNCKQYRANIEWLLKVNSEKQNDNWKDKSLK
jgi:hypothetical protein